MIFSECSCCLLCILGVIRVSSEAEISDDEADDLGNSSNDDSFIDDRINPTVASADSKASRADMMAVYRFLTPRQSISCACPCVLGLNLRYTHTHCSIGI